MGTGSRMMSCTAEARVEGRRHSHHPSHHQQGDGRVRVQVESVLERFTLPSTTFHRHPHCTCVTQRAPNTGTSTYARKSWSGHPWVIWHRKVPPSGLWLCGSASTWQWLLRARKERRGLPVVTGTTGRTSCGTPERLRPSIHHPLYATAHSAAQTIFHLPQWSRASIHQALGVLGYSGHMGTGAAARHAAALPTSGLQVRLCRTICICHEAVVGDSSTVVEET